MRWCPGHAEELVASRGGKLFPSSLLITGHYGSLNCIIIQVALLQFPY